ncbi:hypothetical protein AUEXF2481DRAFT_36734 [Aureobasidium subglaciale EXF-2481]|uniref:Uncharacterized protein n=1 Tax=Aureobasidium subglaciale (strain EXF-2481) TaxID=1043005 RepID=A0A074ZI32_AURSE|nr:uncharacterized protein AUEXF2481DRAFT_36734 [Aureobasidium subglaciale EXF-2481]KEQ98216.1 hypothetical protein AUEXF2481DRAFT_36734 [Aureobasidium subglaciale EXF-2481]
MSLSCDLDDEWVVDWLTNWMMRKGYSDSGAEHGRCVAEACLTTPTRRVLEPHFVTD